MQNATVIAGFICAPREQKWPSMKPQAFKVLMGEEKVHLPEMGPAKNIAMMAPKAYDKPATKTELVFDRRFVAQPLTPKI